MTKTPAAAYLPQKFSINSMMALTFKQYALYAETLTSAYSTKSSIFDKMCLFCKKYTNGKTSYYSKLSAIKPYWESNNISNLCQEFLRYSETSYKNRKFNNSFTNSVCDRLYPYIFVEKLKYIYENENK